jgi:hypothetical protein
MPRWMTLFLLMLPVFCSEPVEPTLKNCPAGVSVDSIKETSMKTTETSCGDGCAYILGEANSDARCVAGLLDHPAAKRFGFSKDLACMWAPLPAQFKSWPA